MEPLFPALKRIIPRPVFDILARAYHFALAGLAAVRYGFPSRALSVIGVTGTDGKTTVVHLLHEMLSSAGHRVGSLSSLRFKINDREEPNLLKMTMPGRFRLQRFLAECRADGCRFAVIEVTSQGIVQSRHRFIRFSAAVLTNVTPEHIEAHGGFEAYRAAKVELFRRLPATGAAVLNRDDPSAGLFAAGTRAEITWYARREIELKRVGHPVRVLDISPSRLRLEIDNLFLESGLGGAFNVMNVLAAAACAMAFGVSLSAIAAALARQEALPGRLEYVEREPFAVVVDYANSPVAYEAVYQALTKSDLEPSQRAGREAAEIRKLICVFGAPGGGRDQWKRPELGKIAAHYCREIILTSDDPEDEDPSAIGEEIRQGIPSTIRAIARIVLDRREAIRAALKSAKPGDTVVITGMGAQPWLMLPGGKIPWDDRRVVREELAKLSRE